MKQEPKLPQNINNLLMEIGEKSTIFYLYLLTRKKKWNVYYNLNEVGCDIVLIESGTQRQLNIRGQVSPKAIYDREEQRLSLSSY